MGYEVGGNYVGLTADDYVALMDAADGNTALSDWLSSNTFTSVQGGEFYIYDGDDDMGLLDFASEIGIDVSYFTYLSSSGFVLGY